VSAPAASVVALALLNGAASASLYWDADGNLAGNNINGVGITSIVDYQVLPLKPQIQAFEEAYIRKVVDAVQDLPNVLYEVANESSGGGSVDQNFAKMLGLGDAAPEWGNSTDWQYWVIDVVKRYEREKAYVSHPIGMTMQFPVADQTKVNDPLFASHADWISPGYDDTMFTGGRHPMAPGAPPSRWYDDPPVADGRKVIITDTDHYAPGKGDALWAWKSFLRGHNPILMDFGLIGGVKPGDPGFAAFEAVRFAMGDTRRYAERVNLIQMEPRSDLSSSGYALATVGKEYLVLQPNGAQPFTVDLPAGTYTNEWFNVATRETQRAGSTVIRRATKTSFTSPFGAGPAVLYLRTAK